MRKILFILFLIPTLCYGADTSVPNLTEDATPGTDSLLYTVDNPAGTPVDRKATIGNVLNAANDLDANGDVANDSHNHTTTTISGVDISDDTNLSGNTEIVLTGDALTIGSAITRDTEWDTISEINTATTDADIIATNSSWSGGDLGGTGLAATVTNDSHDHTATTVSGLATSDFTSPNISQWTNNSGYISSETDTLATVVARGSTAGGDISASNVTVTTAITENSQPVYNGGETPGGELGGTFASFTVDATHSGSAHHSAVTVSGTPDYITLSGQDLVRAKLDISDDTNATAGTGINISGNTISNTGIINEADTLYSVVSRGSVAGGNLSASTVTVTAVTIGANTLNTSEWAYLDGQNQAVTSGSSPNFNNSNMTGNISVWTNNSGYITSFTENDTLYSVVSRGSVAGANISASNIIVTSGTASAQVVDTQYLEYSSGGNVTVRDGLTVNGAVTANNIAGNKTIQFTVDTPASLSATDLLPVWSNESGKTFNPTSLKVWSDKPYNVILKTMNNDGSNVATFADFGTSTLGTNIWYGTSNTASGTIVNTQVLYFDASAQVNNEVKITVSGTLN